MEGKQEKERFIFFKYVPPKKSEKQVKGGELSKGPEVEEPKAAADDAGHAQWLGPPVCEPGCPGMPGYPPAGGTGHPDHECPEVPECPGTPGYPDIPECPELPEPPECPEYPDLPELPEYPECPELPEPPECPGPEEPEIPEGPCPENAIMHVIQAGDTFWKLAKVYGTTVEAIAAANPNVDPLNLQIGESICIPIGIPGAKG